MKLYSIYTGMLFLCFCSLSCNSQKAGIGNQSEDAFLKWLLPQNSEMYISKKTIALEPTHFLSLMKEIKFSKSDSISIQKQINKNNTSNFRYSFFAGKIFLGDSLLHIEKHKDGNTYLKISKPFFFEKGKKVWIFVEEYCPDTCGGGNIEIYEKSSQGYKLIGVVPIWIS